MDDNIASFLTGGKIGKWLARRVIGNYTLPNFDFHIANSPYTAEEFYNAYQKGGKSEAFRLDFSINAGGFSKLRAFRSKKEFSSARAASTATVFARKKIRRGKTPRCASAPKFPKTQSFCFTPEEFRRKKTSGFWLILWRFWRKTRKKIIAFWSRARDRKPIGWKSKLKRIVPDKIVQLGHLDKELWRIITRTRDVFVHPNPREPFGIAPLEAMASGVPIVAPNAGGILSYATDENIWLVEPTGENFASACAKSSKIPNSDESKS